MTFKMRMTTKIKHVSFIRRMGLTIILTRFMFNICRGRSTFHYGLNATFRRNRNMLLRCNVFFKYNGALYRSFFFKSINVIFTGLNFDNQNSSKFERFLIFLRPFKRLRTTSFACATLMNAPYTTARMATCGRFCKRSFARRACHRRQVKYDRFPIKTSINYNVRRFYYGLIRRLSFRKGAFQRCCIGN